MGVPVIAPGGSRPTIRIAHSILAAGGKAEWIGDTDEDVVRIAGALSDDAAALAAQRGALRDEILDSPLCDEDAFASRFIETLREYCAALET